MCLKGKGPRLGRDGTELIAVVANGMVAAGNRKPGIVTGPARGAL